jgi:hypothetical protein
MEIPGRDAFPPGYRHIKHVSMCNVYILEFRYDQKSGSACGVIFSIIAKAEPSLMGREV